MVKSIIGKSVDRYNIIEQLGEGGMAVVYKATDSRLGSLVAIKVISIEKLAPQVLERTLKRFEREARSLAQLTHPNIVKVMDYGEWEGQPYLVMPYLPGGTLKGKLGEPIPYQEAARLLSPIAHALEYAHKHNLIHRDVKPSNILITETGQPMLSDFGIARIIDDENTMDLTGTRGIVGTPEYMSPEQGLGKAIDPRSDIYSLGIVLYEMVTGKVPYKINDTTTPMEVIHKHAFEPLPPPIRYVPALPKQVEQVLLKALAKKPEERYQTMGDFAAAMEGLVQGGDGSRRRTRSFHWLPWGIGAGVLALIALAIYSITNLMPVVPVPTAIVSTSSTPSTLVMTQTSALEIGSTLIRDKDGMVMVYVPEGDFLMGSDPAKDNNAQSDEQPQHRVYLDAYWIDQTEVTNAMYKKCVDLGTCTEPDSKRYSNSSYANHPVVYVDWNQAKAYCAWAGADLPMEAQWEKAARGTDGRLYPWGDNPPSCYLANYSVCVGETTAVRSYGRGISPYGAYDMAGNVWEWVNDGYDETYYKNSPSNNPQGPSSENSRVVRSGSWKLFGFNSVRSADRYNYFPNSMYNYLGFRCARSAASP